MRKRICFKVLIIALLLVSSAASVLPQSVKKEGQAQERVARAEEGSLPPRAPNEQEVMGVVLAGKRAEPVQPAQTSPYPHFIDPVNGMTADDLVRYALAHNGELAAARQMIDILTMLQEKTAGNLTEEEEDFLTTHLGELKLAFVQRTKTI